MHVDEIHRRHTRKHNSKNIHRERVRLLECPIDFDSLTCRNFSPPGTLDIALLTPRKRLLIGGFGSHALRSTPPSMDMALLLNRRSTLATSPGLAVPSFISWQTKARLRCTKRSAAGLFRKQPGEAAVRGGERDCEERTRGFEPANRERMDGVLVTGEDKSGTR